MPRPPRSRRPATLLAVMVAAGAAAGFAAGAAPVAAANADHLILSEVNLLTRVVSDTQRASSYIELVNPTGATIDLSNVYVTDATYSPTIRYCDIVLRGGAGGGGTGGDFHARFPDGATIAPGDTVVIALRGTDSQTGGAEGYQYIYGRLPDYELYEDGTAPDEVPEMVEVFPGSIGCGLGSAGTNTPELASTGETVVLYRWDGQSDLVQDLDYVIWGSSTQVRTDKSDVSRDGPDGDATASTYLNDTSVVTQTPVRTSAHAFLKSYQRRSLDEGAEAATGGNGSTGHNETSEPLSTTWSYDQDQTPPLAPAVLTQPAPIVTATVLDPLVAYGDQAVTVNATVLAHDAVSAVSLFWSEGDGGAYTEVAATNASGNLWTATIPGRSVGTTIHWYVRATGGNGRVSTRPSAAPLYANSYLVQEAPFSPPLLLFTEVCVQPTNNEFVEIVNPNATAVDLSHYYLTDAVFSTGSQYYWRIVLPNPTQATVGGGNYTDFHAKFPDGATIAAGDTITIAIAGSDAFSSVYLGLAPDYELVDPGNPAGDDSTDTNDVPNMRAVFPGSINGVQAPGLTNASEVVVLYYWDGQTDLVTDIDMFSWGNVTTNFFSKTGVSIDGPDDGSTPTAYLPDTAVGSQQPYGTAHANGFSFTRLDGNEGTEIKSGGNGTFGHNETSENLPTTFTHLRPASPAQPGQASGAGGVALDVPARTFLPRMGEAFPVRFRSRPGSVTEVRIFDLNGRRVLTLFDSRFNGAVATAEGRWTTREWNGRDGEFEYVPAGTYIVHLVATDLKTGDRATTTAPVVVATRLSD